MDEQPKHLRYWEAMKTVFLPMATLMGVGTTILLFALNAYLEDVVRRVVVGDSASVAEHETRLNRHGQQIEQNEEDIEENAEDIQANRDRTDDLLREIIDRL